MTDLIIKKLIKAEEKRQKETLMMIPSENYASKEVLECQCSVLNNKYAEGYPDRRYYQGNKIVDQIEQIAIDRAKKLFNVPHVNVQPYSGSPANAAAIMAVCDPGDAIMGLKLSGGGHLTHGHPKVTFSGKFFKSVQFEVNPDGLIDYGEVKRLALAEKPKLIIAGTTAYPRKLDFKKFGEIADEVGAYLLADISHIAGLVVAGVHPTPVPHVHMVMTTTHKTLRGPRGAILMITKKGLDKDPDLAKKIDKAVFPGLQGGPHEHVIAAIAVALKEASTQNFVRYGQYVVDNAKALSEELLRHRLKLTTGGTDNHLMVIDLRPQGIGGRIVAQALEAAGIIVNYNTVPHDTNPPANPSGIRLGTPALTTRGMRTREMKLIGHWIADVIFYMADNPNMPVEQMGKDKYLKDIAVQVRGLCKKFWV